MRDADREGALRHVREGVGSGGRSLLARCRVIAFRSQSAGLEGDCRVIQGSFTIGVVDGSLHRAESVQLDVGDRHLPFIADNGNCLAGTERPRFRRIDRVGPAGVEIRELVPAVRVDQHLVGAIDGVETDTDVLRERHAVGPDDNALDGPARLQPYLGLYHLILEGEPSRCAASQVRGSIVNADRK